MLQKLKQRRSEGGFTLVELLIVIVVIAILAAIVINTFAGVQARARDTERQTDMKAVASQLEVYYTNEGEYPTDAQMTGTAASTLALFEGLGEDALENPLDTDGDGNSFATGDATTQTYEYDATPLNCDNTTTTCDGFIISWVKEQDAAVVEINSLN